MTINDISKETDVQGNLLLSKTTYHEYYDGCEDGDCGGTCYHCTLSICKVCGGTEGSLTTHCPGTEMNSLQSDLVYAGHLDFRCGHWMYGMKTRGMYKSPFDYLENEKAFSSIQNIQPVADLVAVKETKKYLESGKDWVKMATERQGERDLAQLAELGEPVTVVKVMQELHKNGYTTSLSDAELSKQYDKINSMVGVSSLNKESTIIALVIGSKIKTSLVDHNDIVCSVTDSLEEMGSVPILTVKEWRTIQLAITALKHITMNEYSIIQNAINDTICKELFKEKDRWW